ncbi:N-acetyltransferase [Brevibacillus reuszeri]|uniref:GNAT family N-acetyltransferase n=1 Tax=Brevibacillus reuszeri TaxID=54915 RepID=UPI001AFD752B|nr:GNAT family N-acetyltransferase [Brevibacillus reuszeri]GIO07196.1 N-acetyltransferase [Brevibacillus reuszeri]
MDHASNVALMHFAHHHEAALQMFELPEEQEQFTSLPQRITEVTAGQHRIVIISDQKPVGFFLLHATDRVKEYSENPKAMLLTSFSIDHVEQGKGYAKRGMLLLPEFVKTEFPTCNEIVLAVNHKNIPAQKLYLQVGFSDTGRRRMGPIGEQLILCLSI